jgi:hypothetical protein
MERAGARPRGREKGHRRLGCPGIKVECQNKVLVLTTWGFKIHLFLFDFHVFLFSVGIFQIVDYTL